MAITVPFSLAAFFGDDTSWTTTRGSSLYIAGMFIRELLCHVTFSLLRTVSVRRSINSACPGRFVFRVTGSFYRSAHVSDKLTFVASFL